MLKQHYKVHFALPQEFRDLFQSSMHFPKFHCLRRARNIKKVRYNNSTYFLFKGTVVDALKG